jgi:N-acetylmuramoyl-L-alanine amidase
MCTKKYILLSVLLLCCAPSCNSFSFFSNSSAKIFKISLNPAAPTDRAICDYTEEYLAFEICQAIQTKLTAAHNQIQVNLTREPGAELSRIQIANRANQAQINLFLSLHVYQTCNSKPTINIFYYAKQRFCSNLSFTNLNFINYSDAYLANCDQTINWGHKITNYLDQNKKQQFEIEPLVGLPFKPLAGIQAPTLSIEIGLKNSDWHLYITPITEAILACILPTL